MSGSIIWPAKTPAEVIDYGLNWKDRLLPGEYLVSSDWVCPEGITVGEMGLDEEYPKTTVIWLSGGISNKSYCFINRIGTSDGRIMEMSATLSVKAY